MGGRTQDEVVLRDLSVTDLLGESVLAVIDIDEEPDVGQLLSYFGSVLFLETR